MTFARLSDDPGFSDLSREIGEEVPSPSTSADYDFVEDPDFLGPVPEAPPNKLADQLEEETMSGSRVSRLNDTSAKLGQKMMAGWTLLDKVCPKHDCGVKHLFLFFFKCLRLTFSCLSFVLLFKVPSGAKQGFSSAAVVRCVRS